MTLHVIPITCLNGIVSRNRAGTTGLPAEAGALTVQDTGRARTTHTVLIRLADDIATAPGLHRAEHESEGRELPPRGAH